MSRKVRVAVCENRHDAALIAAAPELLTFARDVAQQFRDAPLGVAALAPLGVAALDVLRRIEEC